MAANDTAGGTFALLSHALASMIEREARDLEILREQEATPRPHGRPQGLEWAIASLEQDIERTRQARELLTRLAPIEVDVRAMLEGDVPVAELVPIHPNRILRIEVDRQGRVYYRVKGLGLSPDEYLRDDQIWHLRRAPISNVMGAARGEPVQLVGRRRRLATVLRSAALPVRAAGRPFIVSVHRSAGDDRRGPRLDRGGRHHDAAAAATLPCAARPRVGRARAD